MPSIRAPILLQREVRRGDCENRVVQDGEASCTFVEDMETCALPPGWKARPPDVDPARWSCPIDHRWGPPIDCLSGEPERDTSPGGGTVLAAVGPAALAVYLVTRVILVIRAREPRRE